MKRITVVTVLLIALALTLNAGVGSVMQSLEREIIEPGSSKDFNDSINIIYQVTSLEVSAEVSIKGDDSQYISVKLNKWVQDTVSGYINASITVSVSKDAPDRELFFSLKYSFIFPNGRGYESSLWMINSSATEVETFSADKRISGYPNPTSSIVHVKGLPQDEKVKLSVFDFSGKKVIEQFNYGETATVDLSGLKKGVYLISLDGDNKTTIKISKE